MRTIAVLCLTLLMSTAVNASGGEYRESVPLESELMGRTMHYSVYLPEDFNTSQRHYPVLYLLHGYTGNETDWGQKGRVKQIVDELAGDHSIAPMVIVMPDAGNDWYVNSADGSTPYEDYFFKELMPHVEKQYRIRGDKTNRAIAGLSMGGHGTLLYALKRPDLFAAAAPISAAAWGEEYAMETSQQEWDNYLAIPFGGGLKGKARLTAHVRANFPLILLESASEEDVASVHWYIDCGDDDFLIEDNFRLSNMLRTKQVPHQFRVRDGGHTWEYWRTALPQVLRFVSARFQGDR